MANVVDLLSTEFDQPFLQVVQPTQAGFIPKQAVRVNNPIIQLRLLLWGCLLEKAGVPVAADFTLGSQQRKRATERVLAGNDQLRQKFLADVACPGDG